MSTEGDRMIREFLIEESALAYFYARIAVEAGTVAATLLNAATAHAKEHGNGDSWTVAAVKASEALSDIVVSLAVARSKILQEIEGREQ